MELAFTADDTQLYIPSCTKLTYSKKLTECIADIKNWMTSNFLKLNFAKTERLIIGQKTSTRKTFM